MGEKSPIGCYFICCENNTVVAAASAAAAAAVDLTAEVLRVQYRKPRAGTGTQHSGKESHMGSVLLYY